MLTNLDILRAFAVLCVIAGHVGGPLIDLLPDIARFGVISFFVHTSVVLLRSLDRTPEGERWTPFYVRRVFRIYPLSIAIILLYVTMLPVRWPTTGDIAANLLLVQNITGGRSICGPMWTLPYEMQMYLVLPWIHQIVSGGSRITAVAVMIAVVGFVNAGIIEATGEHPITRFFPCFLCGVLAHQLLKRRMAFLPGSLWPAGIALAIVPFFTPLESSGLHGLRDFTACLILAISLACVKEMPSSNLTRASHFVAKYSFGIYLLHMPILWFAFKYLTVGQLAGTVIACALCVVLPVAAYHLIEAPMIEFGRRLASRELRETAGSPQAVTAE